MFGFGKKRPLIVNIGPIDGATFVGTSELYSGESNVQTFDHYEEIPQLPKEGDKLASACLRHLKEGYFSEINSDFILEGVKFPEKGDDPIIRQRLECNGIEAGRCTLRIVQYDRDGFEINTYAPVWNKET